MSAPLLSVQSPAASPRTRSRSLWRELRDGSANWVTRAVVTVALGAVLSAACLIGAYLLAATFPRKFDRSAQWQLPGGRWQVYPDDAVVAWLFVIAGLLYLGGVAWIWSGFLRTRRTLWYGGLATILIGAVTLAAAILVDEALGGDDDLVLTGIGFLGGAAVLVVWLEVWRRYGRGRPVTNALDGLPDVRCPTCNYRMVGLYESRCPECGTGYTLEALLGLQDFVTDRAGGTGADPAGPPSK